MHPVLFKLGPLKIYTYGFFVFLGISLGLVFALKESKKEGIPRDRILDLIFWMLLYSFLSSRILYIVINFRYFIQEPLGFIFSGSGFVFYGGLLGGTIAALFFINKYKLPLFKTFDILSCSLVLGHSLGRIGCFFYGCCYGVITNSFIGVLFPVGSPAGSVGNPLVPVQLISSFFLIVIFVLLLLIRDRKLFDGEVFAAYIILYSLFRFIIEFYRSDPRGFFLSLSVAQWLSLLFFCAGLVFLFVRFRIFFSTNIQRLSR